MTSRPSSKSRRQSCHGPSQFIAYRDPEAQRAVQRLYGQQPTCGTGTAERKHKMRTAFSFGRLCFRHGFQSVRTSTVRRAAVNARPFTGFRGNAPKKSLRRGPIAGRILFSATALSPAVFVSLNEDDYTDGKTGEDHMLEASREELRKKLPEGAHGLRRIWLSLWFVVDQYIYEPIATGFRFLHLVFIFVPVIVTIPAIWLGGRQKERDGERSGTLWWYTFLVHSMERAGPAFIKVPFMPRDEFWRS